MDVVEVSRRLPVSLKRKGSFKQSGSFKKPRLSKQGTLVMSSAAIRPRRLPSAYSANQGNHGKELKSIDIAGTSYECSTTGSITLINGVATGDDYTNRDGRKITMKSIFVRGHFNVGATPTGGAVRWMVVYDKQPNGAAPVITDIIAGANLAGNQNLNNRARFVVLRDVTDRVEATARIAVPTQWFKRCALDVTFSGTTNGIASISTGALWFVTVGTVATGATSPIVNVSTRVRFWDD